MIFNVKKPSFLLPPDLVRRSFNFLLFNMGWWACAVGAQVGHMWVGPFIASLILGFHLYTVARWKTELGFCILMSFIGLTYESLCASFGLYSFTTNPAGDFIAPLWLISMWTLFGTTFSTSLQPLAARPFLAGFLGAIFGPSSYAAGEGLKVLKFGEPAFRTCLIIAGLWAFLMPALFWVHRWFTLPELPSIATADK